MAAKIRERTAVSNPCFELWLILHHEDRTAYLTTADAERRSKRLDGRSGKTIDARAYMPLRAQAVTRAESLDGRHVGNGTAFPATNPSSGMSALVRTIDPGWT